MESMLHYIWKHKLYTANNLFTNKGIQITIIDPGLPNHDSGPDFFNAKIKIGDEMWAGNIEMHTFASDWIKHKHHLDKAYNSTILHLVEIDNFPDVFTENGNLVHQIKLSVPEEIRKNFEYLINSETFTPCVSRICEIPPIEITAWKSALTCERLERKTKDIFKILEQNNGDWEEVFYNILSRNFGFGINGDAFARLSQSLPLKYILKHRDSKIQIESMLLGQAGLLEEEMPDDSYFETLKQEYHFLKQKFKLSALEPHIFKSLRIRPDNFPHIKIIQLASILCEYEHLFSEILKIEDKKEIAALLNPSVSEYWLTHYRFGKTSVKKDKRMSLSTLEIILINTVVPMMFAYGTKKNLPDLSEKSLNLLESIKPESNSIVTHFKRAGITVEHAGDSQALIQLKREYCEKKKCLYCRIGHKLLSKNIKSH